MKLYEITEQHREIERLEDVPQEAIADTLESIEGEFNDKAVSVVAYILNEEAKVEALKAHKKGIDAKIKTIQGRRDSLRGYLRHNMEACGITKIECDLFSAKLGKPSKVVDIYDEDLLPSEYVKTTYAAIKTEIAKALKDGIDVPGAKLEDGKSRLTIK